MSTGIIPLAGRVVREDPTLTYANSGTAVARFTVVTSRRIMNKATSQWEDTDTTFYRCVAFGPLAENIAENIQRGTAVILQGRLSQEDFTRKDGSAGQSIKFVVENLGEDLRWKKTKGMEVKAEADEEPPF